MLYRKMPVKVILVYLSILKTSCVIVGHTNAPFLSGYKDFLYDLCCYTLRCTRCETTMIDSVLQTVCIDTVLCTLTMK